MAHIAHQDILRFAEGQVNMRESDVAAARQQAAGLREKLQKSIKEHPGSSLKMMRLSGSLAKGTALRTINDIDVALYVKQDNFDDFPNFIKRLTKEMRSMYPNMDSSQIVSQSVSIGISFRGSGLDVDVVPIAYQGDASDDGSNANADKWDGFLRLSESGESLLTNIPKHINFIRERKERHPVHFRQVVRLLKFWVKQRKTENDNFKFKSFLVELLLAHLADKGAIRLDDYVEAMADFFNFILRGGLDGVIAFCPLSATANSAAPIRVFDPANPQNNVASVYNQSNKRLIIEECARAADAIDAAIYAPTKGKASYYWQKVFGPSF